MQLPVQQSPFEEHEEPLLPQLGGPEFPVGQEPSSHWLPQMFMQGGSAQQNMVVVLYGVTPSLQVPLFVCELQFHAPSGAGPGSHAQAGAASVSANVDAAPKI
jgi:hypothetical protein